MAETAAVNCSVETTTAASQDTVQWPLSFQLKPLPPCKQLDETHPGRPDQYWSHALYRGPENKPPQVFYSTTKEDSEVLAQKFLQEPVLGFDGEWCSWHPKPGTPLKSIFSLVQVASEDKIGLFHIARHEGETPEDLIAPSLRRIIESPDIIKTGVKIHGADLLRLQQHFNLKPQGGFELSNLHRLVTHTPGNHLVALAKQVQYHLGLPLAKGPVRTSNWIRPLSAEQKFYAADDAYAGFMLYHCMDAKRVALDLPPPNPHFPQGGDAIPKEKQPNPPEKLQTPRREAVQAPTLQPRPQFPQGGNSTPQREQPKPLHEPQKHQQPQKEAVQAPALFDASQELLFQELRSSRRNLASAEGIPLYMVAGDKVLRALAQARPTNSMDLTRIPGIGYYRFTHYGDEWLHIISQFLAKHPAQPAPQERGIFSEKTPSDLNIIGQQSPQSPNRGRKRAASTSEQEACAAPPLAHTGLSFHMDETSLRENKPPQTGEKKTSDTSALGTSLPSPTSPEGEHKRRRCEDSLPNQDVVTLLKEKKEYFSNTSEAVRGTADCGQHPVKQPQTSVDEIDYFSDQDEEALWAEAFENLEPPHK